MYQDREKMLLKLRKRRKLPTQICAKCGFTQKHVDQQKPQMRVCCGKPMKELT